METERITLSQRERVRALRTIVAYGDRHETDGSGQGQPLLLERIHGRPVKRRVSARVRHPGTGRLRARGSALQLKNITIL